MSYLLFWPLSHIYAMWANLFNKQPQLVKLWVSLSLLSGLVCQRLRLVVCIIFFRSTCPMFDVQSIKQLTGLRLMVDYVTATTSYSGYDAALYSAATMYVAQQTQPNTSTVPTVGQQKTATNTWNFKKPVGFGFKLNRAKGPAKPQQLHYCEVCKISCAGPQVGADDLCVLQIVKFKRHRADR